MNKMLKTYMLTGIFVLFFSFAAAAQQVAAEKISVEEQRQIIISLLNEKFAKSSEKTIYISTANLPDEILQNFPPLKNKKIQLVAAREAKDACAYEFGEFEFIEKFASIAFGNCREGLAYDFLKTGGEWKSVGLVVKETSY